MSISSLVPDSTVLSAELLEQFLDKGYVTIRDCFSREAAHEYVSDAFDELGYDPDDRSTWTKDLFAGPGRREDLIRDFSPKLWSAICGLLGGEERILNADMTMGWWVINFHKGADTPWQPPSAETRGWHNDGLAHRHFLDSGEQGLLVLPLFSDVEPQGGGTALATDSLPPIARYLRDHPEGVDPNQFPYQSLAAECHEFIATTGKVGDVALVHPHLLHASTQNHSQNARFMKNINMILKEPMCLHRENVDYSPVEEAILRALDMPSLDFRITAPRTGGLDKP